MSNIRTKQLILNWNEEVDHESLQQFLEVKQIDTPRFISIDAVVPTLYRHMLSQKIEQPQVISRALVIITVGLKEF